MADIDSRSSLNNDKRQMDVGCTQPTLDWLSSINYVDTSWATVKVYAQITRRSTYSLGLADKLVQGIWGIAPCRRLKQEGILFNTHQQVAERMIVTSRLLCTCTSVKMEADALLGSLIVQQHFIVWWMNLTFKRGCSIRNTGTSSWCANMSQAVLLLQFLTSL